MRQLVDAQEYRYQLSVAANPEEADAVPESTMADCMEQCSTGLERRETGLEDEMLGGWSWAEEQGLSVPPPPGEEDYLLFID